MGMDGADSILEAGVKRVYAVIGDSRYPVGDAIRRSGKLRSVRVASVAGRRNRRTVTATGLETEMARTLYPGFSATDREQRTMRSPKPCGHRRHVGPCPSCQRAQLGRWYLQLAQAARAGRAR